MTLRPAVVTAWLAVACVALPAAAAGLTLDDAFWRVIEFHPELRRLQSRQQQLDAEVELAAQRPALQAGVELENVAGTGDYRGARAAEITLHLGSVLERSDKSRLRARVARESAGVLQSEADAQRLDLLAEVARRYLAVAAAGQRLAIDDEHISQRARTVELARQRLAAGASPEAAVLAAEAALTRARLARERTRQELSSARVRLAGLWGSDDADFEIAQADLLTLPSVGSLAALERLVHSAPEITRFASERRVAEARLRLARAEGVADPQWQAGVRRLEAGNDFALVAGVTLPLGARSRAGPQRRAAAAELAGVEIEHESASLALRATLQDAHGRYQLARLEVEHLREEVLPLLARAEAATARAWNAGATGYADWAQLQGELIDTRRRELEAAIEGHLALIEIQRLTGHPFLAAAGDTP